MKAGEVVKIRVSPKDVMTAIDLVQGAGLVVTGMSLAEVVRLAMSGLMQRARETGAAPNRDGFEYMQMLAPFKQGDPHVKNDVHHRQRALIAQKQARAEQEREAMDMPPLGSIVSKQVQITHNIQQAKDPRKHTRFKELVFKRRADQLNFSEAEQAELDQLFDEGYRV